jgi:hypothetical protein
MKSRHFTTRDKAELRAKIDKAKPLLPLPNLMLRLGYREKHIGRKAICPFHDDANPSFSVFKGSNGKGWQWKCHAGCGRGDEITFVVKHFDTARDKAIKHYLDMAGFPARRSREYPKSRGSRVSPACPVSPVSEGQTVAAIDVVDALRAELKALAAQNACTPGASPEKHSWQLARDLKAVAKRIGRKPNIVELMIAFDEWHRCSKQFLGREKTRDEHWMRFLAQLQKVRVPTGEGRIAEALEYVSKLTDTELPIVPGYGNALAPRKLMALHRELSRRSTKKDRVYFLSYRDASKVCHGLSHQEAHTITFALAGAGVIEIVSNGKAGLNSGEAAEFRCLLPEGTNEPKDNEGLDL